MGHIFNCEIPIHVGFMLNQWMRINQPIHGRLWDFNQQNPIESHVSLDESLTSTVESKPTKSHFQL